MLSTHARTRAHARTRTYARAHTHARARTRTHAQMEVGIEDCLHIEFEYDRARYHLEDVVVGKIYFLLVGGDGGGQCGGARW